MFQVTGWQDASSSLASCAKPLLFFLGFCPVCSVFAPREGCGLAGALRKAWRDLAGPPQGPCPLPPAKQGPLLPAGPGRAQWQALCDAPVAMAILDEEAIAFCLWKLHPSAPFCSSFPTGGSLLGGSSPSPATAKVSSVHPPSLGPPFNPSRDHCANRQASTSRKPTSTSEVMLGSGQDTKFTTESPCFSPSLAL